MVYTTSVGVARGTPSGLREWPPAADPYGLALGAGRFWCSRWDNSIEVVPLPAVATVAPVFAERILLESPHAPVAPSPDGRWLALGEWPLQVIDVATGAVAASVPVPAAITALVWIDAETLLVGLKSGHVATASIRHPDQGARSPM